MNANQWQWRDGVLTCELLSDWQHGFFTRSHAPKLPNDLHNHLADSGKAYRAKQVHGNRLIHANEIETIPDSVLPEADGVWQPPIAIILIAIARYGYARLTVYLC